MQFIMAAVAYGVLTVSDRCSKGEAKDTSGPNLKQILSTCKELQISEDQIITECVPDEKNEIQRVLLSWVDTLGLSLILTTGGTGFSPRDVTPEAVQPLLEKEAPGLSLAMISKSLAITPMAMLSRPVCGIRRTTLIVTLPGSKKGSQECLSFILPALNHALDLLGGSSRADRTHSTMQNTEKSEHSHTCPHRRAGVGSRTKDSFYPVAFRPRKSPYPMLSVNEALDVIIQHTPAPLLKEERNIFDALRCVLGEDVDASMPLPPFPASIKDGYAVLSSDGPGERKVIDPSVAGESPTAVVTPGTVARITTGAPLPSGADAVVQVEDTELVESSEDGTVEKCVKILTDVKSGHDVRQVGSDVSLGQRVLECGELLQPSSIGIAASVGVEKLCVYKPPTIALLSTGNEVVNLGQPLGPAQIYDSNRPTLTAFIKERGFTCLDLGIAKDTREALVEVLTKALDGADVVITTGGVSMGEKDLLKPVLETDFGAVIHFGRVFMKPGKPTTFATAQHGGKTKLIFALPGNPVSATATFQLFVLPALKRLAGWANTQPTTVPAKLASTLRLDPRPEYHRVHLSWSNDDPLPVAISTGNQRSSRMMSVRDANALLELPPRREHQTELNPGSIVKAVLIGSNF